MRARLRLLALCLACVSLRALAAPPEKGAEPQGIAAFTRHSRFLDAKISPKGTYLAILDGQGGRQGLLFLDLATRQVVSELRPDGQSMVSRFEWVSDRRVVAELATTVGYFAAPLNYGELYAVDADGKNGKLIFGYRSGEKQVGSHIKKAEVQRAWAEVIDARAGEDRDVLIATRPWDEAGDRVVRVKRLNVFSGVTTDVTVGPIPQASFLTDEKGEARVAVGFDQDFRFRTFLREPGGTWAERTDALGLGARVAALSARDRLIYLRDGAPGGFGLYAVGLDGGPRKLLAQNAMVPPSGLVLDPQSRRVLAVEWEPDLPSYDFLEPEHPIVRALKGLLAAYPDDHVRFLNATDDGKTMAVKVYSDRNPGQFLVVDVAKLTADPVGAARPWVKPAAMAEMTAFHVKASDGLLIHGYVTLPPGRPASAAPPPLVVLPHGGPHFVRDDWEYDREAQLLAREGFAVLQVNYRGSGGYGDTYREAGFGKWGTRMIEDLVDATRFAIRKGWADPKRICTYGGSYGGYAAVQMAIVAPELVRCVVGYAGVYDLQLLGKVGDWVGSRRLEAYVRKAVGEDEALLAAASPARNAAKLTAKVLLIHGGEDRRVPIDHAEALRDALVKAGRPPEWLVEPKEGHGFYDEAARERMYTRLVAFLKENTAPLAAPPPPAAAPAGAGPAPAAAPAR